MTTTATAEPYTYSELSEALEAHAEKQINKTCDFLRAADFKVQVATLKFLMAHGLDVEAFDHDKFRAEAEERHRSELG